MSAGERRPENIKSVIVWSKNKEVCNNGRNMIETRN
jgi:hypothetical protein